MKKYVDKTFRVLDIDYQCSDEEVRRNIKLQRYYPLGTVNAIWELVEGLNSQTSDRKEKELLGNILDVLSVYDQHLRDTRYRIRKKKKK